MEKKYDLIGIANPGQDLVVELEALPRDVVSSRMYDCSFQGGGWVATALCAAGNLGAKTSFLGVIGDDVFGNLSACAEAGAFCAYLSVSLLSILTFMYGLRPYR